MFLPFKLILNFPVSTRQFSIKNETVKRTANKTNGVATANACFEKIKLKPNIAYPRKANNNDNLSFLLLNSILQCFAIVFIDT